MIEQIDNANKEQLKQWWAKIPKSIYKSEGLDASNEDAQRYVYDEIAHSLSEVDEEWVAFLSEFVSGNDVNRRCSALFFLTNAGVDNEALRTALDTAFQSKNTYLKGTALQGYIHIKYFPLDKEQLDSVNDEWLEAWALNYRCKAFPREKINLLESALKSRNPLVRSFACDIIGSELIEHLKPKIKPLLKDQNEHVAEVAAYVYHEVLD